MSPDSSATVAIMRAYALVLMAIGLTLLIGGGYLVSLGGSPYYLLCGSIVLASGAFLWQRRAEGAALYGVMLLASLTWALWESGYNGWALMPRVMAPSVLGMVFLIPPIRRSLVRRWPAWSTRRIMALFA